MPEGDRHPLAILGWLRPPPLPGLTSREREELLSQCRASIKERLFALNVCAIFAIGTAAVLVPILFADRLPAGPFGLPPQTYLTGLAMGLGLAAYNALLNALMRPLVRGALWRRGRCTACGYSLEGNVSGTCPECGASAVTG